MNTNLEFHSYTHPLGSFDSTGPKYERRISIRYSILYTEAYIIAQFSAQLTLMEGSSYFVL
jgi:hypothetical protein